MVEPVTTLVTLAGTGLFLLAQTVATNKAAEVTQDKFNSFRLMFRRAQEQGKLPSNHHLERGTARACLKATQICIHDMLEEQKQGNLAYNLFHDTQYTENTYQHAHESNENNISGLLVTLDNLIRRLQYVSDPSKRDRQHKKLLKAIDEGALKFLSDALEPYTAPSTNTTSEIDSFGGKLRRLVNSNIPKFAGATSRKKAKTQRMRKVRETILPDLEAAVIEQVLRFGGWQREALREELRAFFFGEEERWAQYFSLCYTDEIRVDKELNVLVVLLKLEKLDEGIQNISTDVGEIKASLQTLQDYRNSEFQDLDQKLKVYGEASIAAAKSASQTLLEVRRNFQINESVVFYSFDERHDSDTNDNHRPFYFGGEADEFIGREDVLDRLHEEFLSLNAPSQKVDAFKWVAICGAAGTGKSRLALHILNNYKTTWRLSGFVNREFLDNVSFNTKELCNITAPTLFVIDYADISPVACRDFLEQCASVAGQSAFPIRVIILIRRTQDHFFRLVGERRNNGIAIKSQLKFDLPEGEDQRSRAVFLSGLSEKDTATLMRRRIEHTAESLQVSPPKLASGEAGDKELIEMLRRYDKSLRPLLAIIIAYVFTVDSISLDQTDGESQEDARLRLFWNYLQLQFSKRWTVVPDSRPNADFDYNFKFDTHLNFLLLSTMCRGLTDEEWAHLVEDEDFQDIVKLMLPGSRTKPGSDQSNLLDQDGLLAALSGHVRSDNGSYPIFEPDLLGESLVLLALDQRGRDIELSTGMHSQRRANLRNLAWSAGLEGAKFFSVLTAQDFPKKSAELNWLLPDTLPSGAEKETISLFRNLVLSAIEPFWTRAAEISDIEYIEKLIVDFEPPKTAPEDVWLSYLTGVVDLTGWVAFVINKGFMPGSDESVRRVSDKLDMPGAKRSSAFNRKSSEGHEEEFADAANQTHTLSDATHIPSDRQSIYEFRSDEDTLKATVILLRKLYDRFLPLIFSDELPLVLRMKYTSVLHYALTSIFWDNRAKEKSFGYALEDLSEEELAIRKDLALMCQTSLEAKNTTEDTVVIVASLLQGYIYAEHGSDPTRGITVFEIIQDYAAKGKFTNFLSISVILNFLGNYTFNRAQTWLGKLKDDPNIATSDLSEIDELAKVLVSKISPENSPSEKRMKKILNSWCDLGRRLALYYKQTKRNRRELIESYLGTFEHLAESNHIPVTKDIINLTNLHAEQLLEDDRSLDDVINNLGRSVKRGGYDPNSTNSQNWYGLKTHFEFLINHTQKKWFVVDELLENAQKQIGDRATRELAEVICSELPNSEFSGPKMDWLENWVLGDQQLELATSLAQKLTLTFVSQRLLISTQDQVYEDIETLWNQSQSLKNIATRTTVLLCFKQVLLWYGYEANRNNIWRERLLNLIGQNSKHPEDQINPADKDYIAAIIDCVSAFTAIEIEMGLPADGWLEAGDLL